MVFMTLARMDKGAMRATNQAGNLALQLVRLASLLDTGVLELTDQPTLVLMATLVTCGLLGAKVGDALHGAVSTQLVRPIDDGQFALGHAQVPRSVLFRRRF